MAEASLEGSLLGVGNPLLDITANVGQAFLDQYGLVVDNAIIAEEKHKPLFDEISTGKVEYAAGGATLNAIRVAQWLIQEAKATGFIGAIGKDQNGDILKKCAQKDGVALHAYEAESFATGTCAVLINEKQHSLVANLAAAKQYSQEHFDSAEIRAIVQQARVVYSASYFLTVSPAIVHALGARCAADKKIFAISLGAAYVAQNFSEPLLKAIEYSDFVFATETDARAFAKAQDYSSEDVRDIAQHLAQLPKANRRARVVVITRGTAPTLVAQQTRVLELPVAFQATVVDPNGMGDAFVGGFLAGLVRGLDIEDRVHAGHYAASVIAQVTGCTPTGAPQLDLQAVQKATEHIRAVKRVGAPVREVRRAVRALKALSGGEAKDEEEEEEVAVETKAAEPQQVQEAQQEPASQAEEQPADALPEDVRTDPAHAPEEVPAVKVHVDESAS